MLKNLKVAPKLLSAFITISLIGVLVGILGIHEIRKIDDEGERLYEKITVPTGDLGRLSVAFQRVRINLRDAVESENPAEEQQFRNTITQLRQTITEKAEKVEKNLDSEDGRKAVVGLQESRKVYGAYVDKILELKAAGKKGEALALLHGEAKKAALHEQDMVDKLVDAKEAEGKVTSDNNCNIAERASLIMMVLVVTGAVLAIVLGLVITRMITAPLKSAVNVADRIADWDLTVEVPAGGNDEIGELLTALQAMTVSLRELIAKTAGIAGNIASASAQLHSSSEQIATGAEEVAAQAGTVATASEEMACTSTDIARNCAMAADAAQQSTSSANAGAAVVQETVTGMGLIAESVRQSAQTVEALGARSEEIGNIIGTIEDIADQTNLLALNAAIEAARAGEQGRGFAVVADEVRALAERTTKATREIGEMIKAIQDETRQAVGAMNEGVVEAEKGTESSRRSGQALEEILARINEVSIQVSQIATAAEQQTATTGEVTSNIHQITGVVEQTARGAEETASAAAQLSEQAQELHALVGRFKV